MSKDLLPFTRPRYRRGHHRGRGRGAAFGLARQRPACGALRAGTLGAVRRTPRARAHLGHRGAGSRAHGRRHRRRRRSHHHAHELVRHRQCHPAGGRAPGVRRHRSRHPQPVARAGGKGRHAAHARHHAGAFLRPAAGSRRAVCLREAPRTCASSKTRRTPSARPGAARPIGSVGDLVCFSFHPNKNITTGEGGAHRGARSRRSPAHRARAFQWRGARRAGRDGRDVRRAQVQHVRHRRRASASASCRTSRNSMPAAASWRTATSRAGATPARCGCRRAATTATAGTCSRRCCRQRAMDARANSSSRMRQQGIAVGVHYPAIHLFTAYREAGLARRHVPECRARRARDRHAAAVSRPCRLDDVDRVVDAVEQILGVTA